MVRSVSVGTGANNKTKDHIVLRCVLGGVSCKTDSLLFWAELLGQPAIQLPFHIFPWEVRCCPCLWWTQKALRKGRAAFGDLAARSEWAPITLCTDCTAWCDQQLLSCFGTMCNVGQCAWGENRHSTRLWKPWEALKACVPGMQQYRYLKG